MSLYVCLCLYPRTCNLVSCVILGMGSARCHQCHLRLYNTKTLCNPQNEATTEKIEKIISSKSEKQTNKRQKIKECWKTVKSEKCWPHSGCVACVACVASVATYRDRSIVVVGPFALLSPFVQTLISLCLVWFIVFRFEFVAKNLARFNWHTRSRPNICHSCVDFRFLYYHSPQLFTPYSYLRVCACPEWTSVCSFGASIMLWAIVKRFSVISFR